MTLKTGKPWVLNQTWTKLKRPHLFHRFFPDWHLETVVCSVRGHVMPARYSERLDHPHSALGLELADNHRLLRCTRCDTWKSCLVTPEERTKDLPSIQDIVLPRRGHVLKEAVILRLIAINKGFHAFLFFLVLAVLTALHFKLGGLHRWSESLYQILQRSDSVDTPGRDALSSGLHGLMTLKSNTINTLMAGAGAYAVVESVECVGLWKEKRWAEYLTALATTGLMPLEVHEIIAKISPLRVGALVVNLMILIWLVWAKRLFGLRGGAKAMQQNSQPDSCLLEPLTLRW